MEKNIFDPSEWRVIVSAAPSKGAWNMAVDEAVMEQVEAGQSPPTLRLYCWNPACLSLGYAQTFHDIDFSALNRFGWDWVRRQTGGRAILHTDEITYSVIGLISDPRLKGSILESYLRLSQALLHSLELLGIPAVAKEMKESPNKQPNPVCFEVPSNYEITVDGKKLLGSAQARRRTAVLQHGALPLSGDLSRITRVLVFPDDADRQQAAERLLQRATSLETVTGKKIAWDQAAQAFLDGFKETLNLNLIPGDLSPQEIFLAKQLVDEKYGSDQWNRRL